MGNNVSRSGVYDKYYDALKRNETRAMSQQPIDMSDIDPYEVLGVSKNFQWDELKSSYKRIAKLVHPDKGGSEILFNTVTECFRKLANEYKAREEKTHSELRDGSRQYYQQFHSPPQNTSARDHVSASRDAKDTVNDQIAETANFIERFNRTFEANRLTEDDDGSSGGYGAKMVASTGKVREDFNIPRVMKKYDSNAFNKVFDAVTLPNSTEVIRYVEPEPLPLAKKIQYTELGKGATDDFSSTQEGEGRRSLQYTDYMKAYTTTRLVDPRAVQDRKTYRTVDEYEGARADAFSRPATSEEIAWREKKSRDAEIAERERLERLRERDKRVALHHEKVNRLMLR